MLEIRTLGGLQLAQGGEAINDLASRKAEALLVYLTVTARPQSREVLADFFWDERSQSQSLANLRTVLSSLRQHLGAYLEITRDYAGINPDAEVWLDLFEFEKRLGAARLEEAIDLYQGEFLEGFYIRDSAGFEVWLAQERQRCQNKLQGGLHAWVRYHVERGSYQEGIAYAEQLLVIDPHDEEAFRQLILLLSLCGQHGTVSKRYQDFTNLMESELGVAPSQQTVEVFQRLVNVGEDHLAGAREMAALRPRAVGECPYRGLAPFREVDAPFFYGREAFTGQMEEAVTGSEPVTVILGASGSGKSSVVFAGLLPWLRRTGGWQIVSLRPGHRPFENFAAELVRLLKPELSESNRLEEIGKLAFALQHQPGTAANRLREIVRRNGKQRVVLVIDQFEELYTLCKEPVKQQRFLDELLNAVGDGPADGDGRIVMLQTMRADFMGQALAYRPFADAMQDATLMLGPMTRGELRAVIEKPAEKQGAAFEPGLVERILNDVGEEPGNLPLLEFALTLLWGRLDQGWLTHKAYEEIGQVAGALTRYAEEVFASLDELHKERTRKVFIQLVQPGEGAQDTRRVATRDELAGSDWELIKFLADKRLVVTSIDQEGNETVEVVHEALIRSWDRLRRWMEEDRAFRSWQEGLRVAIRQWEENQEDEGGLLRGRSLVQAEGWLIERSDELGEADRQYIETSIDLRDRRERERARLRRRIFAGLGVGLVIMLVLSVFSYLQRNQALESYSMSLAAHVQAALDLKENDLALSLALSAVETDNPPPTVVRMLRQAAYAPGPIARINIEETFGMDQMPFSMAVSPTEFVSLIGFHDGTLILWDVMEGREIRRFEGHTDVVADVAFSPDGKTALSGSYDTTAILWDLETGEILNQFKGNHGWVRAVAISPDGSTAATGGFAGTDATEITNPGELTLWDTATGEEITRLEGHPSAVEALAFSPDGSKLLASSGMFAAVSNPASLYYWDLESEEIIHKFDLEYDAYDIAITPDGSMAISTSIDSIEFWDLSTGNLLSTYGGYIGMPRDLELTPYGDQLVTIDSNGKVTIWKYPEGTVALQALVHEHVSGSWSDSLLAMTRINLSQDGNYALSVADDNTIVIWDLREASEYRRLVGHESPIGGLAITPEGKYALTGSGSICFCGIPGKDNSVRFWDVSSGEQIYKLEGHQDYVTMTHMTPDGKLGISSSLDGTVRVWDLVNGEQIRVIENAHTGGVFSAIISPDGKLALTGSVTESTYPDSDGVKVWDLETGEMLHHYFYDGNAVKIILASDGNNVYAGDFGMVKLDLLSGDIIPVPSEIETCCVGYAISSDGKTCYSASNTDTVLRSWNLETGKIIQEYGAHGGNRTRVELSADDQVLLSSGVFGSLYLWDISTGNLLRTWNTGAVHLDIDMTADGKLAISPGPNNSVLVHQLDLPIKVDDVKDWIYENRVVRELTCEERATYSIEPLCD